MREKKSNLLLNGISKLPKCHVFFSKSYKTLFNPGWACSRSILVLGEGTSPHLSVSQLAASATSTLKTFSPTGPLWARLVCKSLCPSFVCCPLPCNFFQCLSLGIRSDQILASHWLTLLPHRLILPPPKKIIPPPIFFVEKNHVTSLSNRDPNTLFNFLTLCYYLHT